MLQGREGSDDVVDDLAGKVAIAGGERARGGNGPPRRGDARGLDEALPEESGTPCHRTAIGPAAAVAARSRVAGGGRPRFRPADPVASSDSHPRPPAIPEPSGTITQ